MKVITARSQLALVARSSSLLGLLRMHGAHLYTPRARVQSIFLARTYSGSASYSARAPLRLSFVAVPLFFFSLARSRLRSLHAGYTFFPRASGSFSFYGLSTSRAPLCVSLLFFYHCFFFIFSYLGFFRAEAENFIHPGSYRAPIKTSVASLLWAYFGWFGSKSFIVADLTIGAGPWNIFCGDAR